MIDEKRGAPFYRLRHVRTHRVDEVAQMDQDRFREVLLLRDVCVDTGIAGAHDLSR